MKKINQADIKGHGMPCFSMKDLFKAEGDFSTMKFSLVEIQPGHRVPEEGYSQHAEDEYSYFVSGELLSWNAGEESIVKAGDATLIPKGELHYCENRGTEPCVILCTMID